MKMMTNVGLHMQLALVRRHVMDRFVCLAKAVNMRSVASHQTAALIDTHIYTVLCRILDVKKAKSRAQHSFCMHITSIFFFFVLFFVGAISELLDCTGLVCQRHSGTGPTFLFLRSEILRRERNLRMLYVYRGPYVQDQPVCSTASTEVLASA